MPTARRRTGQPSPGAVKAWSSVSWESPSRQRQTRVSPRWATTSDVPSNTPHDSTAPRLPTEPPLTAASASDAARRSRAGACASRLTASPGGGALRRGKSGARPRTQAATLRSWSLRPSSPPRSARSVLATMHAGMSPPRCPISPYTTRQTVRGTPDAAEMNASASSCPWLVGRVVRAGGGLDPALVVHNVGAVVVGAARMLVHGISLRRAPAMAGCVQFPLHASPAATAIQGQFRAQRHGRRIVRPERHGYARGRADDGSPSGAATWFRRALTLPSRCGEEWLAHGTVVELHRLAEDVRRRGAVVKILRMAS